MVQNAGMHHDKITQIDLGLVAGRDGGGLRQCLPTFSRHKTITKECGRRTDPGPHGAAGHFVSKSSAGVLRMPSLVIDGQERAEWTALLTYARIEPKRTS